jgi:hypothetical protein
MEALKIIPQVFFDIIARVVPGCTAIVAWLLLLQKTWELSMSGLFGTSFAKDSTTLSFLIFLGAGYVAGELISPLAKGMQRINKNIPFSLKEYKELKSRRDKKREEEEQEKTELQKVKVPSGTEHANASKKTFSEEDLSYDRLRLQHPEVGALCAKIRAEFTMHNALAVVFGFSAVGYPFSPLPFHWLVFIVLVALTWLTAFRGKSTNKTFNETKAKFDLLIKEQKASAKNAIPEIPSGTALANESSALFQ